MNTGEFDITGRVAVVTGGGQGIGRAYARALVENGVSVVVADINGEAAKAVCLEIEGGALAVQVDVSCPDSVSAMTRTVLEAHGRYDILINNAALFSTLSRGKFEDIPLEEWRRVLDVNVTGSFLCARAATAAMREAGWGRIINISSSTVPLGLGGFLHYVTSKSAVIGMTRALARELGADGITVNAIMPGLTQTEVEVAGREQSVISQVVASQCIPRLEVPRDLVGTMLFLSSPASAFITGQTLLVDGGSAHL